MRRDFTFPKNFRDDPVLRGVFCRFTPPALYGADIRLGFDFGFWEIFRIPHCREFGSNVIAMYEKKSSLISESISRSRSKIISLVEVDGVWC